MGPSSVSVDDGYGGHRDMARRVAVAFFWDGAGGAGLCRRIAR